MLFHFLAPGLAVQVILIAVLAFLLRCFGPANYGVFVTALTALVVLMFAVTGVAPSPVIASRAINTVAGGAIALLGYLLWPTWERRQVGEMAARMLDGYRDYFHWVAEAHLKPADGVSPELHRARLSGRLARSNLEASVARLRAEPRAPADRLPVLDAILANSHRFIRAAMSLEAAWPSAGLRPRTSVSRLRERCRADARNHGRRPSAAPISRGMDLPDLRQDHHALITSRRRGEPGRRRDRPHHE